MGFDQNTALVAYDDPLALLPLGAEGCDLAFVVRANGPSYRPFGALMSISALGKRQGSLSLGCVEDDITRHALEALANGQVWLLKYGKGSPYFDITLPCGGGLEILLLPRPNGAAIKALAAQLLARQAAVLCLDLSTGSRHFDPNDQIAGSFERQDDILKLRYLPPLRFLTFGKGPEAVSFFALAQTCGYAGILVIPDAKTEQIAGELGVQTQLLSAPPLAFDALSIDARCAILLFFHDHDFEPPFLAAALQTKAFYIGAQGSRLARQNRDQALHETGTTRAQTARLYGLIGLIPSARDPHVLAVLVLAEVLAIAQSGDAE